MIDSKKLLSFLDKDDADLQGFQQIAMASFFLESLLNEDIDLEEYCFDLNLFRKNVGEEIFAQLYPCYLEFFLSNSYPASPDSIFDEEWNALDLFLNQEGDKLSQQEKDYYQALRQSYMGIYEVIDINNDNVVTLKSLIKFDKQTVSCQGNTITHTLTKGDILGARVILTSNSAVLGEGCLRLPKQVYKEAKKSIEGISGIMLQKDILASFKLMCPDTELMVRKMWVKEITASWFMRIINPLFISLNNNV